MKLQNRFDVINTRVSASKTGFSDFSSRTTRAISNRLTDKPVIAALCERRGFCFFVSLCDVYAKSKLGRGRGIHYADRPVFFSRNKFSIVSSCSDSRPLRYGNGKGVFLLLSPPDSPSPGPADVCRRCHRPGVNVSRKKCRIYERTEHRITPCASFGNVPQLFISTVLAHLNRVLRTRSVSSPLE